MIETTLGALVDAEPALTRLLAVPLPVKTGYALAKLGKLVRKETAYFHEQREAAIRALGAARAPNVAEQAVGHTEIIEVTAEHRPAFFARIALLGAIAVTIPWEPIALDALGDLAITGEDLLALEPLLTGSAV